MQTKLTLRMDDRAIAKAKRIAKQQNQSVSNLFTRHINALGAKSDHADVKDEIPEWIKKMKINPKKRRKGAVKSYDELKCEYLKEKYLKK